MVGSVNTKSSIEIMDTRQRAQRRCAMTKCLLMAGISLTTLSGAAFSQDDIEKIELEEVIVTAQRRSESLIDVPTSLTSLNAQLLEASGVNRLRDIGQIVPNLIVTGPNTNGRPDYVIRGIQSGGGQPGFESAVGIYIDGVYMGRETSANPDIVDIERVEILRGPQGTLYGKNSVSGAINITTVMPGNEASAKISAEYGNYDLLRFTGSFSAPIVEDKLYAKISAFNLDRDGYTQNVFRNESVDNENSHGLRLHLRATPTDQLEINLTADGMWEDRRIVFGETAVPSFSGSFVEGPHTVAFDAEQTEDRAVRGLGLKMDYQFDSDYVLTFVAGLRDSEINVPGDADESPLDFAITDFQDSMEQFSAELRLTSPDTDKFNFIAGLFFYDASNTSSRDVFTGSMHPLPNLAIFNDAEVQTTSYAAFVNINYEIADRLILNLGGRLTHEKKEIVYSQQPQFPLNFLGFAVIDGLDDPLLKEDNFSPSISLRYELDDDWSAYAKVSRGFKSGGWSTELISTPDVRFQSEFLTNYELGLKGVGLDNRLRVSLAAFYMDYKDLQVVQIDPVTTFGIFTNAGSASSKGVEAEFELLATKGLLLSGGFGYTDATFDEFENCSGPGVDDNCNGNRLTRAPKYTANVSAQYTFELGDGELVMRGGYAYRGDLFFNAQNTLNSLNDSYGILKARISYNTEHWELSVWGENLTDKEYFNGIAAANPIGDSIVVYGNPRTYGVKATVRF